MYWPIDPGLDHDVTDVASPHVEMAQKRIFDYFGKPQQSKERYSELAEADSRHLWVHHNSTFSGPQH